MRYVSAVLERFRVNAGPGSISAFLVVRKTYAFVIMGKLYLSFFYGRNGGKSYLRITNYSEIG